MEGLFQNRHYANSISMYPEWRLRETISEMNLILVLVAIALLVASPLVSADDGYQGYLKDTDAISKDLVRMVKSEFNYRRHFRIEGLYLANQGFLFRMNVKHLLPAPSAKSRPMGDAEKQARDVRAKLATQMQELQAEDRRAVDAARHAANDDDRKKLQARIAAVEGQLAQVRKEWIASSQELVGQVHKSKVQRRKDLQQAQLPEMAKVAQKIMAWLCAHPSTLSHIPETEHLSIVLDGVPGNHVVYVLSARDVVHCNGDASGLIDKAITYSFN